MKKLILIAALTLTTLTHAYAQTLEAKSIKGLIHEIQNTDFTYKETGMIFGFVTTQSCLFTAKDLVIFKNYCFPIKPYPAKGYTIVSKTYGIIDLYQERLPSNGILKQDVVITQFPDVLAPFLTTDVHLQSLNGISGIMEKMYHRYFPGCWSTNFSHYTETPHVGCTVGPDYVKGIETWINETQSLVNNNDEWAGVYKLLDSKLVK